MNDLACVFVVVDVLILDDPCAETVPTNYHFLIIMNIGVLVKMMMTIVKKISKMIIISLKHSTDVCLMLMMIR